MESTAIQAFDLFASDKPTLEQIEALEEIVNSSEKNQLDFALKLENNLDKTGGEAELASGIALCMLERYGEAIEKLNKAKDGSLKCLFLAEAQTHRKMNELAVNNTKKAVELAAGDKRLRRRAAYIYQDNKRDDEAQKCFKNDEMTDDCNRHIFKQALYEQYHGDEGIALGKWEDCVDGMVKPVNAMLNLAVRLEDKGRFEEARTACRDVLDKFPNHKRAILFIKDIEAAADMVLDEEKGKLTLKRFQMLDTPITDFELSVRSRNCLKKMNIHTVGDLLRTSEAELLSYKNFGETSLREIKAILDSKNLRLGMECENAQTMDMSKQSEQDNSLMTKSIDELRLSVRARKCLDKLNLRTLGELVKKTEAELLGCKNFGVTSLNEIKKAIEQLGLSLRSLE